MHVGAGRVAKVSNWFDPVALLQRNWDPLVLASFCAVQKLDY